MTIGENIDCWMIYPIVQQVPSTTSAITSSWPSTTCLISPGVFEPMNGYNFDLSAMPEGVVAWFGAKQDRSPAWYAGGRLILAKSSGGDLYALAQSLSIMLGYGVGNTGMAPQAALYQARFGAVFGLCGDLAGWYMEAFKERGYPVRECVMSAFSWTGWGNDAHTCFEIFFNGSWKFFDSYGHYLTDATGNHLSFQQILTVGGPQHCILAHLRTGAFPAYFCESANVYTTAQLWPARAYSDLYMSTDAQHLAWLQQVMQVPAIADPNNNNAITAYMPPGGSQALQTQLQGLGFNFITQAQWIAKFYPNNGANS